MDHNPGVLPVTQIVLPLAVFNEIRQCGGYLIYCMDVTQLLHPLTQQAHISAQSPVKTLQFIYIR